MGRVLLLLPVVFAALAIAPAEGRRGGRAIHLRPRVVGYFPQWGVYAEEPYYLKTLQASGGAVLLDQLNYAEGSVANGRCAVADPMADLNLPFTGGNSVNGRPDGARRVFRGNLHQLAELKRRYPRLKVLISLEGSAASFAADAQPGNREAFVRSCVDVFLRGRLAPGVTAPRLFDGIDVDWEYPHAEDGENFLALLREFRRAMNRVRPGLRLAIAVGPSPRMYPGTDVRTVAALVDEVGVMNYDYSGPWSPRTGLLAPLYAEQGGNIDRSMTDYLAAGVPAGKLLMGVPFYGYGWTGVGKGNHGLYEPGEGLSGDRPYAAIAALGSHSRAYRDEHSQAPWLFDGHEFWTYDDPVSLRFKMDYARSKGLGGVMIWELSGDTREGLLLKTVRRALDRRQRTGPARQQRRAGGRSSTPGRMARHKQVHTAWHLLANLAPTIAY